MSHCKGCGRLTTECPGCDRELDPPRFCPRCGRRLRVLVTPGGWQATCAEHGGISAISGNSGISGIS